MAARNSNSRVPIGRKIDPLLPYSIMAEKTKKPRLRMRSLLGHCHYRRVFTWLLAVGFLVTLFFIKSRNTGYDVGSYLSKGSRTQQPVATFTAVNSNGETVVMLTGDMDGDGKLETVPEDEYVTKDERKEALEQLQKMPWLKFPQFVTPTLDSIQTSLIMLPALTDTSMVFEPLSARPTSSLSTRTPRTKHPFPRLP